jgi:hypothetical protein
MDLTAPFSQLVSQQVPKENHYSWSLRTPRMISVKTGPSRNQKTMEGVKITTVQEGSLITVFSEPTPHKSYNSKDTVVSCLRLESEISFHVTYNRCTVYFLEYLRPETQGQGEDEAAQKYSPTRLAKTDRWAAFYHMIMGLPIPKPRNIEKEIKFFKWSQFWKMCCKR